MYRFIALNSLWIAALLNPVAALASGDPPFVGMSAFASGDSDYPCGRTLGIMRGVEKPALAVLWDTGWTIETWSAEDRLVTTPAAELTPEQQKRLTDLKADLGVQSTRKARRRVLSCVERFIYQNRTKPHLIEMHLKFRLGDPSDIRPRQIARIRAWSQRIHDELSPHTIFALSTGLEDKFVQKDYVTAVQRVEEAGWTVAGPTEPTRWLITNPVDPPIGQGKGRMPIVGFDDDTALRMLELHGDDPSFGRRRCVANLDGVTVLTARTKAQCEDDDGHEECAYVRREGGITPNHLGVADTAQWLSRYEECAAIFLWYAPAQGYVYPGGYLNAYGENKGGQNTLLEGIEDRRLVMRKRPARELRRLLSPYRRSGPDAAPVGHDDVLEVPRGVEIELPVLDNDAAPGFLELDSASISGVGQARIEDDGQRTRLLFRSDEIGTASVRYVVGDLDGQTSTAEASVYVVGPAEAVSDRFAAQGGEAVAFDVLGNDYRPEDLTLVSVSTPTFGVAVIEAARVAYSAPSGLNGEDSFSYTVRATTGTESTARVVVAVASNRPPEGVADSYSAPSGTEQVLPVLRNDIDPDGDSLSVSELSQPSRGRVTRKAGSPNILIYTPSGAFAGTDFFSYRASDGQLSSGWTQVDVASLNRAPTAVPDSYCVLRNTKRTMKVRRNDSDPDQDRATLTVLAPIGQRKNGVLSRSVANSNVLEFTPNRRYVGPAAFRYQLLDPSGALSNEVTVTLTVQPSCP